jgi:hypothetical protein
MESAAEVGGCWEQQTDLLQRATKLATRGVQAGYKEWPNFLRAAIEVVTRVDLTT